MAIQTEGVATSLFGLPLQCSHSHCSVVKVLRCPPSPFGTCWLNLIELPYCPLGFLLSRNLQLSPQVVSNPLSKLRRQPTKNGVCCAILIGDPRRSCIVLTLQKSMICKRYCQMPLCLQEIDIQWLFACMMMTVDCWRSPSPSVSQCTLPLQ